MPKKSNYSHMMSDSAFFSMWETHKAVIYYVIKRYANKYPIHTMPGYASTEDTAGKVREEFHRLGIFARFNPARSSSHIGHYIGAQTKSCLQHLWQDHCRLNNRFRLEIDTVASMTDYEDKKSRDISVLHADNITKALDPDFNHWAGLAGSTPTDTESDTESLINAISNAAIESAARARNAKRKKTAWQANAILHRITKTAEAPTNKALSIALGLDRATTQEALNTLRDITASVVGG